MNLNEYIRHNYKTPNRQILETLGANDKLIEYLMETPWNTNLGVIDSIDGNKSSNKAIVGEAVVGTATI